MSDGQAEAALDIDSSEPIANRPAVITVRMHHWLHEELKQEAAGSGLSLNQLCIKILCKSLSARKHQQRK